MKTVRVLLLVIPFLCGIEAWAQATADPSRVRVNVVSTFRNDYGQPVEGVTVKLVSATGAQNYEATVGGDGSLRFENVQPGDYLVQLQLADFVFVRADRGTESLKVTVEPDGTLVPDSFEFRRVTDVQKGMWKQILLFLGLAAAGGAAVI